MNDTQTPIRRRRHARAAFTLLELIISVALTLVLMLAITKIFSITSTTLGTSQGLSAAVRDARAAQTVFARDISSMAPDSPFVWIRSDPMVPAFRNAEDMRNDRDYPGGTVVRPDGAATSATDGTPNQTGSKLTIDLDGNGTEGESTVTGENVGTHLVSTRNHRLDRFSFFARDRFSRQTGNRAGQVLVSSINSPEAWITYGHLDLPRNDGTFYLTSNTNAKTTYKTNPGDGTEVNNPNNFYASQWILGRVAMVMVLPTNAPSANGSPTAEYIVDENNVRQEFIKRTTSWTANGDYTMTPITDGSKAYDGVGVAVNDGQGSQISLNDARYDLIGIDITNATARVKKYHDAYLARIAGTLPGGPATDWYPNVLTSRFQVNPLLTKPVSADTASQQVPVFLPACSQFMVEYAGDFVEQDATGAIADANGNGTALEPDGQIDFVVTNGVRQIRWYGFPRDTNGDGLINVADGDVTPLSDFVLPANSSYTNAATNPYVRFEHMGATTVTQNAARSTKSYNAAPTWGTYYAAWGPDSINNPDNPRPRLYRIVLTIDRPEMAGRTADGQTFEYVFSAP